ncbi:AEC family transporter [Roseomonas sp. SSH11]|uniref:AEC family transporter n=1 Tax=Pararoseomonas baculiformis TaxID=2820812 RepID=A0ABS4A925_9PROT|nr:AEC family transporter [Pararoseomonas baculiformis]MBP0443495.1 AEC family transporter [Pararoseomonas baculiformis]
MGPWLDAFLPAFGMIALGAFLKRRLLREDAVWAGIEKLVFWVLLPCLLASSISAVDLGSLPVGGMAAALWITLLIGTGASLLLARGFGQAHPAATSVLQAGIRFNNLLGFAIAGAVFGMAGNGLAAVATGLIVPCVQVIITFVFAMGGGRARPRPLAMLRQMALNPLIIGCAAGFAISALGGLPPGVAPLARILGQASVALGLLAVGAALGAESVRDRITLQGATAAWKLLAMPALTLAFCTLFGLDALPTAIATLFMALPTASTAYVMARMMGGDAPIMAAMTTLQHLLAVATLPVWLLILRAILPLP